MIDGVLYRSFFDASGIVTCFQLILPAELKVPFLELVHNDAAGHLKYTKCLQHVMRRAWWLNWKQDLSLFIRCCHKCESFHRGQPPRQANLRPMVVGSPAERWSIDLQGPFPASHGYTYIFTAICTFSKFGVCVPLRNKEATTVARAIVDHVFLKWGLCQEILVDLGPEFQAELLTELLNLLGINRLRTSGYRPQTNGACEVWHRTLNSMLAKVISETQKDCSQWLAYVTFCYNATEHSATGFPPFFVFTGRLPLWTVDLILPTTQEGKPLPEYTAEVVNKLRIASDMVRENLQKAACNASQWYNRKVRPRFFNPGDKVMVYYPRKVTGRTCKWQSYYSLEGEITEKINDATYIAKCNRWPEPKIVHVDKLKIIETFPETSY